MRGLVKYAKVYAICACVFCLLMLLVSLVPKAAIQRQVGESATVLTNEGDRPLAWPTMHESPEALDSFTTSLSLNIAMHTVGNPVIGAVACPYYRTSADESMSEALVKGMDQEAQIPYWRYWHGYLTFLVPLLTVFDIAQIRKLFLLGAALLIAVILAKLGKRDRLGAAAAFVLAMLFSNIWIVTESTAQFFCYLVGLVATLYVVCKSKEDSPLGEDITGPFFFVVGAVTVFLDFLDTPIVSLGLPLATYVVMRDRSILQERFSTTAVCLSRLVVSWAAGYALLWLTKWAIGLLVLGGVAISELTSTFDLRLSDHSTQGEVVPRFEVLRRNVAAMVPGWMVACAKVLGVVWVAITCFFHRKYWWKIAVSLVAILAMPAVWYFALPNHAIDHTFFTYRSLSVSVYALGLMVAYVTNWDAARARLERAIPKFAQKD